MKTIIVATDFSKASENAAFYAANVAGHIKASIVLVHVLPLPLVPTEVPIPGDSYEILQAEAEKSIQKVREKLDNYAAHKLQVTYSVTMRSFLEEAEDLGRKHDIFAFVMGTHEADPTDFVFLGSFSLYAAKHLHHPVILVPPVSRFEPFGKIGLACDMKDVSGTVPIQEINTVLDYFNAKLEILHVSKSNDDSSMEMVSGSRFIRNALAAHHPEIRIIENKSVREGLDQFIHDNNVDLLILIPKERNFIEDIFHASITKKMVLKSDIPVMVLHEKN